MRPTVATDLQNGVTDRFKSMPKVGASALVGHVAASVVLTIVSTGIREADRLLAYCQLRRMASGCGLPVPGGEVMGLNDDRASCDEHPNCWRYDVLRAVPAIPEQRVRTDGHNAETARARFSLSAVHTDFETLRSLHFDPLKANNRWLTGTSSGAMLVLAFGSSMWLFYRIERCQ